LVNGPAVIFQHPVIAVYHAVHPFNNLSSGRAGGIEKGEPLKAVCLDPPEGGKRAHTQRT